MIGLWFWADDYSDIGIPLRWELATPNIESSGIWWDWGRSAYTPLKMNAQILRYDDETDGN
jgi:hypothetical protein